MVTNNSLNNSSSPFDVDNLHLETNTISSSDTNGPVIIDPNGTGNVEISSGDLDVQAGAVIIDPGAATDSYLQYNESTTGKWRTGNDATDDSYRIAIGSALGTNDSFVMSSGGNNTLPLQVAFKATFSSDATNVTGDGTAYTMVFDSEEFDIQSNYDTGTGVFTAPEDGNYLFVVTCEMIDLTSSFTSGGYTFVSSGVNSEGITLSVGTALLADTTYASNTVAIFELSASDTVHVSTTVSGSTKTIDINGTFAGVKLA